MRPALARTVLLFHIACLFLLGFSEGQTAAVNDLAVIVNRSSAIVTLSSRDLRSIFLGGKDTWSDGTKVFAVSLPAERPETRMVLKKICGMSAGDFTRYFLMMNFQGKSVSPPRMVQTPSALRSFVSSTPGALGVIRVRDVDATVSVMHIDGAGPGAPGYKLAMTEH